MIVKDSSCCKITRIISTGIEYLHLTDLLFIEENIYLFERHILSLNKTNLKNFGNNSFNGSKECIGKYLLQKRII